MYIGLTVLISAQSQPIIIKIGDLSYEYGLDITCDAATISNSGISNFTATITIADHPSQPPIDNRLKSVRASLCYGTPVELLFKHQNSFIKSKDIPPLFIISASPYDINSKTISLEVGDVLSLLQSYTIDHWKNPEDLEIIDNEDEDTDTESFWFDWEDVGTVPIQSVINKIFSRLGVSHSVNVSGDIYTPYSISGSLIDEAGRLAFHSDRPSVLWVDNLGVVRSTVIDFDTPLALELRCDSPTSPIDLRPIRSSPTASQIIYTGTMQEIVDEDESEIPDDDGDFGSCIERYQYGAAYNYDISADLSDSPFVNNNKVLSIERVCTKFGYSSKTITTTKKERFGIVFPDFDPTYPYNDENTSGSTMIDSYFETLVQEFEPNTGEILREVKTVKEPFGKVFGGWYANHMDWHIVSANYPNAVSSPSEFPDIAKFETQLVVSETTETVYEYTNTKQQKRITTTTTKPALSILTDYVGTARQGAFTDFSLNAVASSIVEEWVYRGKTVIHRKTERQPAQLVIAEAIKKRENFLHKVMGTETFDLPIYVRLTPPFIGANFITVVGVYDKVSSNARLALQTVKDEKLISEVGKTNPPLADYMASPSGDQGESENLEEEPKVKEVPISYRINAEPLCTSSEYSPQREIVNIGNVRSRPQLRSIAEVIFNLRQCQTLTYDITLPYKVAPGTKPYKPFFRVDIFDCCNNVWTSHIAHGMAIELTPISSKVSYELLWLGSRTIAPGIDIDTGYTTNAEGQPIHPTTGEVADRDTGLPINSQGQIYDPHSGYLVDTSTGFTKNYNGDLIDPSTGLLLDLTTGFPTDGVNLIDPVTTWILDERYRPIDPSTQIPLPTPATPVQRVSIKDPPITKTFNRVFSERWGINGVDRTTLEFNQLWGLESGLST